MYEFGILLVVVAVATLLATWLGYPSWLRLRARDFPPLRRAVPRSWWPEVTIVVTVHNAEATIRGLLNNLLALAYPGGRRHILVVSDASTDFTDAIVAGFDHRGVELLRLVREKGTARATNIARRYVRGDIVVVVDPEARLATSSLAALISPFADPSVGVAYAHESGGGPLDSRRRPRLSAYTSFEAMLRDNESRVYGTVSARRSLYAMRGPLFHAPIPPWVSPDFNLTLLAAEHGYRAVHVDQARCTLTRPRSPRRDYARTVWATGRDALTLLRKPHLLNPRRFGEFSWMLIGHKIGRWATPWAILAGYAGVAILAAWYPWARVIAVAGLALAVVVGALAMVPARGRFLRLATQPGHIAATSLAMAHGVFKAFRARAALRNGVDPGLDFSHRTLAI
ncbi:MAG TPA: glycosyltransferase [Gemmatimonadales bacterium]